MRALLIALTLLAATPAPAATPLPLVERQVVTLEFTRPVASLATTDPNLLALEATGSRLRVTALAGGRAQVDVVFDDGATVTLDVAVAAARRPAAAASGPEDGAGEVVLRVGQARRLPAPGLVRVLVEQTAVVQAVAEPTAVVVTGVSPGRSSLVLVDADGGRTTVSLRVIP